MMIIRAALAAALATGVLTASSVTGQPKSARVGMLRTIDDPSSAGPVAANTAAFKQGLMEAGYIEGRNLSIEYRAPSAKTNRLEDLARELVRLNVDVIYAVGPPALRAGRAATTAIPIVAHDYETDPVAAGIIAGYARPGGNVTGIFLDLPELTGKWLELLQAIVPSLKRVAVVWDPGTGDAQLRAAQDAAHALGLTAHVFELRDRSELNSRFQLAAEGHAGAVVILGSPLFTGAAAKSTADAALRARIPSVSLFKTIAEAGGLLAYGPKIVDLYRQGGRVVAKILNGARPADIPIERPARFELVINMKTAKALRLTIPPSVLGRADRVIE